MAGQEQPGSARTRRFSLPFIDTTNGVVESEKQQPTPHRYSVSGWMKDKSSLVDHQRSFAKDKELDRTKEPDRTKFISHIQPAVQRKMPSAKPSTTKVYKTKILIWADLTLGDIERLNENQDYDHIRHLLAEIFSLSNYKQNLQSSITLDLYYYTLQFARRERFSPEQTSVFFSIIKRIFEVCQETPYGNLDETYKYFKELLFCHCVNRPPFSIELFTKEHVISICNYTLTTFFKHFKLYKYVFTPTIRLDLSLKYVGTSPTSPFEADVKEAVVNDEEEQDAAGEGNEKYEMDFEKIQAQEELKRIVTEYLFREAKKIEGNVDLHLKTAVDALNARIDPLLETTPAKYVKAAGKKK